MERKHVKDPTQDKAIGAVMRDYRAVELSRRNKKPFCVGSYNGKRCKVMKKGKCQGYGSCPFYKSVAQANKSRDDNFRRISSLDVTTQILISEKYHNGMMPWKEKKR